MILESGWFFSHLPMEEQGNQKTRGANICNSLDAHVGTCLFENKRRQIVDIKSEDKLWAFIISFSSAQRFHFVSVSEMQTSSLQTETALTDGQEALH